jgi:hypothetical protein
VKLDLPLAEGLSLSIADRASGPAGYPTGRLQKGLLLLADGRELVEEGVGFGVPILKRGVQTIFPGGLELAQRRAGPVWEVTATFEMNLVERLATPGSANVGSRSLYVVKDSLAALHRRFPVLRGPLTATSNALRRAGGWVTTFEEARSVGTLTLTYTIDGGEGGRGQQGREAEHEAGRVGVAVDLSGLSGNGLTEVVVMNEQGARHFDRYVDDEGTTLQGAQIGTWDEVTAARASFVSIAHGVAFSLGQVEGARLRRGRELIGSRVAWSGFGYSFPPTLSGFGYELTIARVP